jgi:hypothetical protein
MPTKWISCGAGFIEADLIRWKETEWRKAKRKKGRDVILGERLVTAQVTEDTDGWVRLLILECKVVSEKPGHKVEVLAKGIEKRRKRTTIERGKPVRRLWTDESARALVASKFLAARVAF